MGLLDLLFKDLGSPRASYILISMGFLVLNWDAVAREMAFVCPGAKAPSPYGHLAKRCQYGLCVGPLPSTAELPRQLGLSWLMVSEVPAHDPAALFSGPVAERHVMVGTHGGANAQLLSQEAKTERGSDQGPVIPFKGRTEEPPTRPRSLRTHVLGAPPWAWSPLHTDLLGRGTLLQATAAWGRGPACPGLPHDEPSVPCCVEMGVGLVPDPGVSGAPAPWLPAWCCPRHQHAP